MQSYTRNYRVQAGLNRQYHVLLYLLSLFILLAPLRAHADWQWSATTENIGPADANLVSPSRSESQIAVDTVTGNAIAVWQVQWRNLITDVISQTLEAATYKKGRWNYKGTISADLIPPALGLTPQIALSKNVSATIMWSGSSPTGPYPVGQVTMTKGNGAWKNLPLLTVGSQETLQSPQVTIAKDHAGIVIAVWAEKRENHEYLLRSARFKNKKWGQIVTLATGFYDPEPQIVSTKNNDFTVVWRQSDAKNPGYLQTARSKNGAWGPVQNLTPPSSHSDARVALAIDGVGTITAVWSHEATDTGAEGTLIQSAQRPQSGLWSAPSKVGFAGRTGTYPNIKSNRKGMFTVAWAAEGHVVKIVRYDGRVWSQVVTLGNTRNMVPRPEVAIDDKGNSTVVWAVVQFAGDPTDYRSWLWSNQATHYHGEGWSDPILLCNQCLRARISGDNKGNVLAIWASQSGSLQSKRGYEIP